MLPTVNNLAHIPRAVYMNRVVLCKNCGLQFQQSEAPLPRRNVLGSRQAIQIDGINSTPREQE